MVAAELIDLAASFGEGVAIVKGQSKYKRKTRGCS